MGGHHVSFLPNEAFDSGADYVVMYEGEATIIRLLEYIKYPEYFGIEKIKGIAYKIEGELIINAKENYISHLDYLPFSTGQLINEVNNEKLHLLTSRGCPGKCMFCASSRYSGHKFRIQSAEWIFSFIYYYCTCAPKDMASLEKNRANVLKPILKDVLPVDTSK